MTSLYNVAKPGRLLRQGRYARPNAPLNQTIHKMLSMKSIQDAIVPYPPATD